MRPSFFEGLKRRNILHAAVPCAGAVWVLAQGISQLSPAFDLRGDVTRWFVIACAIGFPFWIAFASFYAWTPQASMREEDVEHNPALVHSTGRKPDFAIIGVMAVATVLLASGYFVCRHAPATLAAATAAPVRAKPFNPPVDTLVVLPFTNLNGDPKQQYFSDGITEELTNALGQNTRLTVIAWDTASKYRNSRESPAAIGAALDVATLLNGSIEREGGTIRVIAELVDTRTGKQLWSDHYDDSAANVFAVQDQITAAIARALKVKFAALGSAPTVNPRAHDLVLKARALMETARTAAPFEQARTLLERAIALDPDYADAHGYLANAWFGLTEISTLTLKNARPKVHAEADRALTLDPRNVEALAVLGSPNQAEGKLAQARADYQRALALDPRMIRSNPASTHTRTPITDQCELFSKV